MIKLLFMFINIATVFCSPKKPTNLPCKLDDTKCLSNMATWMYFSAINGNPKTGAESCDPLFVDVIQGNLGYVTYTGTKSNIEGFKSCIFNETRIDPDMSTMHMYMICPRLHIDGDYVIDGKLLTYPIRGKGDYYADTTNYEFSINTTLIFFRKNQNIHLKHETYDVKVDLMGALDFEMRNLFDGNKELSDPIHKFGRENPRLFVSLLHDPIFEVVFERIMKNFNKEFKQIPAGDLFDVNEKRIKLVK